MNLYDKAIRKFPEYEINEDYKKAFSSIERGDNVFITGKGGSGKSIFINILDKLLDNVVILTPTGISANRIGGQTIHSFFGFRPELLTIEGVRNYNQNKIDVFKNIDYIIIDEVSMVRSDVFSVIDHILMYNRYNDDSFGGIQIILLGDLFQLGPIYKKNSDEYKYMQTTYNGIYFFETRSFISGKFNCIEFTKTYRQTDETFIKVLDQIREGNFNSETFSYLNDKVKELDDYESKHDGKDYIYLCNINRLKNQINNFMLESLEGNSYNFKAEIEGNINIKNFPIETNLKLKNNAQIMMVYNDPDRRWTNGTLGEVKKINRDGSIKVLIDGYSHNVNQVQFEQIEYFYNKEGKIEKRIKGKIVQYPIVLAYALSTHKSQSATFDYVYYDPTSTFAPGQTYTALSRIRNPENLGLKKRIKHSDIIVDQVSLSFYKKYFKKGEHVSEEKIS